MKVLSYDEARKYLEKSKEGIKKISDYCNKIFRVLDSVHEKIVARKIVEGEEVQWALDKVIGYRGYLNPIYEAVQAVKKNSQDEYYIKRKDEIEAEGKKFMSASTEREASLAVGELRHLRNKLRGYIDQTNNDVAVLMSKLKYLTEMARIER